MDRAWVLLREADSTCGGKAATLRRLLDAGLDVVDGVVLVVPAAAAGTRLDEALALLGPGPYAVRSSALDEDGGTVSFAGQLLTELHVPAAEVGAAAARVAASAGTAHARAYADAAGRGPGAVAVLVQPMLAPRAAGVAVTRHPVTGADVVVVEAVAGLGDGLVDGSAEPARWVVDRLGCVRGGTDLLVHDEVRAVADLARAAALHLGVPVDVEWALEGDRLRLLQARPLTAGARPGHESGHAELVGEERSDGADRPSGVLVRGTGAGAGLARGPVRRVIGVDGFASVEPGDVLVCRATSPAWTPVLALAAAVVTETGGVLAHAAVVARELGIPAVTGAADALARLVDGEHVLVDGRSGVVRRDGSARGPAAGAPRGTARETAP
ncbi:PEP/pyruvate-binding domain-containing protein [Cellulomonas endophytica]|uniref:PEP/pyruvate-binding domain-containing protein n=1 Tax=Cellulomonas endophytica TaxID=2494735 RepID=UPI001F0BEA14|nr:PEP/pyruvate-binding domain-containing protein [Cellulomonas endophytica]